MLRGVAAVMVVVHHARLSVPGSDAWPAFGASGVDIFFIISGYVMMLTTQGSIGPGKFLLKRIARIVPLYWLATIWTARRVSPDLDLVKDGLFIPHYNHDITNWISPMLQQGWTLNYEMLFYLIFAVAMAVGKTYRHFLILVTLALMPLLAFLPGVAAEFYGNSIVWEFGFGILLFMLASRSTFKRSRLIYLAIIAGGFALLALGYDHSPRALAQGFPALIIVWASFGACQGWLQSRALVLLGDASFAIYLFHWASFGAMKPIARIIHDPNLLMLGHIATAIIAGVAIHLIIEKPVTRVVSRWLGLRSAPEALPAGH